MTSVVFWEEQAQADREAIFRYLYQNAGLQVASTTDDKFVTLAELLSENPAAGAMVGRSGKQRKLTVTRFPFIMVYVTEKNEVRILRVLHTSRRIAGKYRSS